MGLGPQGIAGPPGQHGLKGEQGDSGPPGKVRDCSICQAAGLKKKVNAVAFIRLESKLTCFRQKRQKKIYEIIGCWFNVFFSV